MKTRIQWSKLDLHYRRIVVSQYREYLNRGTASEKEVLEVFDIGNPFIDINDQSEIIFISEDCCELMSTLFMIYRLEF